MNSSFRPPTRDEMQYASDVVHGKRKLDSRIILGTAIAGAILGIAIGFANAEQNDGAIDLSFTLICMAVCAFSLGIIAALILAALRSIMAMCRAWMPARVLTIIACCAVGLDIIRKIVFWFFFPSAIISGIVMGTLALIFEILLFSIGLRIIFIVYCMFTKKDDEEILAKSIAAKQKDYLSKK